MKARIADPEKTSISRQQHGNHAIAVTNNHKTTKKLLEAMFSMRYVQRLYKGNQQEIGVEPPVVN
jgi:hypothetical protein